MAVIAKNTGESGRPSADLNGPNKQNAVADVQRDVYCLFGLPVDNLSLNEVKQLIRNHASLRKGLVLATVNTNWVVRSFADPEFRTAICNSDLVTLDGKPLVWLAKLFGCPVRETVPGSTLVQELLAEPTTQPLTIFLFGGEGRAAETAMDRINQQAGGLRAVGALNPGYGTVEEMSSEQVISFINEACPDILLVALGASKGVAWIDKNRHKLHAGIISHLGATINFLAGTVQRAPQYMQNCGLEWLWRIGQEPKLFVRYAADGFKLCRVLAGLAPHWLHYRHLQKRRWPEHSEGLGKWQESDQYLLIRLGPYLLADHLAPLRDQFMQVVTINKDLLLDFQATEYIDSSFIGLLLLVRNQLQQSGKTVTCLNANRNLATLFRLFCVQDCLMGVVGQTA